MFGYSLGSTNGKVYGSGKGNKLGSFDVKVLGTIIGNVDRITLGIDVRTDLGSLYVSSYVYNDCKIEGLLIGDSLRSTHGKVQGSVEGIKLRSM